VGGASDVTILVWRRKLGGDEMLQVADGKSWRLPYVREIGLRHSVVEGRIGALAEAPAGFDPARTHRWVRVDVDDPDVATAFAQSGAAVVVWRRAQHGPEVLVLHRSAGGPDYDGDWAWTPPGGALDPGETHDECAARELLEETGLDLPITRVQQPPNRFAIFVCEADAEHEIVLSDEHDRYEWVSFEDACVRCQPTAVVDSLHAARPYFS